MAFPLRREVPKPNRHSGSDRSEKDLSNPIQRVGYAPDEILTIESQRREDGIVLCPLKLLLFMKTIRGPT